MMNAAWIFPGQGSQSARMAQKFADRATFQRVIDDVDALTGCDVRKFVTTYSDPELTRTDRAQLAIFAMSMGIDACLREAGLIPAFVAGHSLGHISALTSAGALTLKDASLLVASRGSLMRKSGERIAGGMGVVQGLPSAQVATILEQADLRIWPANLNLPTQTIVAGCVADLDAARDLIVQAGGKWMPLNVSGAFHSPLLQAEAQVFAAQIASTRFAAPNCPVISNLTGRMLTTSADISADLSKHMIGQVHWTAVMDQIAAQNPDTVVEVGPGKILTGLMLRYGAIKPSSTGVPALMDRAIRAQETDTLERKAA